MSDDMTPAEREVRRWTKMYDDVVDCYVEALEKCNTYKEIIDDILLDTGVSDDLKSKILDGIDKMTKGKDGKYE